MLVSLYAEQEAIKKNLFKTRDRDVNLHPGFLEQDIKYYFKTSCYNSIAERTHIGLTPPRASNSILHTRGP